MEGEGTVTLELERFEVFATDAELTVVGDNGSTAFDPPSDAYFRGWSDHDPDTVVMLAVSEQGVMRGMITGSTGAWLLEGPSGQANGLRNRKVDLESELAGRSFECGTNGLQSTVASAGAAAALAAGLPPATNVQYTAYVIVDTDYEYWQIFGNAADAFEYMGDLFAYVSSVYEREIDTNLLISQARLFTSDFDPYALNNAGCTVAGSLQELTAEWSADPTPRTTVHLLSGKTAGQGCANVGVLCSQANGYGVSMGIGLGYGGGNLDIDNPVIFWDSYVVAHEIGHNFNSPHTQGYCTIDGITDPVDVCAAVEGACVAATYAGIIGSLPGPGALTGGTAGAGNGTLMSYCHQPTGGFGNFSFTFGKWHPDGIAAFRVPDRMSAHVADSAACMALEYDAPDLQVLKDCKPDEPLLVGETGICTITVENNGPTMALGVTLEDKYLSDGTFSFGAITATKGDFVMPAGTCSSSSANPQVQSGTVNCDLGELGAEHVVIVKIPVTATTPQNVNDRVSVASDTTDPDSTNNWAEDELNFIAAADLDVFKDCKPDDVLLTGVNGTCTIIVQNFGPSAAANVHVVDTHVSNQLFDIESAASSVGCPVVGAVVTCDYPTIAAGASKTIVVTIAEDEPMDIDDQVVVTSATEDPDTSNNTAADGLSIREDANLRVSKLCKPDGDLLAGDTGTCEILVENLGPSAAENVKVVDTHVSNGAFTIDSVAASVGCVIVGPAVTCNFASIASGASQKVVVSIAENNPQDINDTVSVSSDMFDSDLTNNIATDGLHIVGLANLSITKSDAPDPVNAGENLTYTLTVANTGPSTALSVVVNDAVPAGTSMVSAGTTQGSCIVGVPGNAAQPTVCNLGNILSGGNVTVTIVVTVLPETTGTLHNTATVSSATLDPNNGNNSAAADTAVNPVTGLSVTKTDDQDPVLAGTELKYTVTIANAGPSTATQLSLVDTLPAEVSLVDIDVEEGSGNCIESAVNVVTCDNIADLAPGGRFKVVITVLVDASVPDGTVITNNVDVLEDAVSSVTVSEDTTVNAEADIWLDKTGVQISGNPSRTIRYTLTVYNKAGCEPPDQLSCGDGGPSDALDVVVVDTLPLTAKKIKVPFVSENCVYTKSTNIVTCTLQQSLAAGATASFIIDIQPMGSIREITNRATVTSITADPKSSNNYDELKMVVKGGSFKPSN